ncbi:MAG TPA: c-type cytochrome [Myxococcota bacterium]|nr:c-type cytochrome [Myxococcota bacterium]
MNTSWWMIWAACHVVEAPVDEPAPRPEDETPVVEVPDDPAGPLPEGRTRSGEAVPTGHGLDLLVIDRDAEALLEMPAPTGGVRSTPLGGEPTRMIRDGAELFVTLRASGELAALRTDGRAWSVERRIAVGAEPFDVGLSVDGTLIYVSLSMEDAVVALDRATGSEVRRWAVANEPRWLAVDPDGLVVVASARGGLLWTLDPITGGVTRALLPQVRVSADMSCRSSYLRPRVTGELVVDRGFVYVPALYADTDLRPPTDANHEAVDLPANTEGDTGFLPFSVDDEDLPWCPRGELALRPSPVEYYGPPSPVDVPASVSRFNPALILVPRDGGAPTVSAISTVAHIDSRDGEHPRDVVARSYPSTIDVIGSSTHTPWRAVLGMESMGVVVDVRLDRPTTEAFTGGFSTHARAAGATEEGPVAVRVIEGEAPAVVTWSWLGRRTESWSLGDVVSAGDRDDLGYASNMDAAPESPLPADVLRGRELFYRSDLLGMTNMSSGVSCAACHADARTDGNTWLFADFARQTPSLAGDISTTTPVTWLGDVPTIAAEAEFTTLNRMGGRGVKPEDYAAIEAFVRSVRPVIRPAPADSSLVAEGREVFHRPEVGCAACHAGAEGTSNANVPLYGYPRLNVPPLRGVSATAPYLHDGSALTLRDVIERSRDGSMGDTSSLSDHEMDALEAFLSQF